MSQDETRIKQHIINMLSKPGAEYSIDQLASAFTGGKTHAKNCVTIRTYLSDMRTVGNTWSNRPAFNGGKPFMTKGVKKGGTTYYHHVPESNERASGLQSSPSKPDDNFLAKEVSLVESAQVGNIDLRKEELDTLEKAQLPIPIGNRNPQTTASEVTLIQRDDSVKEWVLQQAKGKCESCEKPSPFIKTDGLPYLEVHHVRQLSNNGPDLVTNAVALCPNCHRELHYGVDANTLVTRLYERVGRLVRE
jgi:hypothetical protein